MVQIKVSANKLAEFITAHTPERKRSIVRQLIRAAKRKKVDWAPPYQAFKTPSRKFMAGGGKGIEILTAAIEAMKKRTGKESKNRDSRNTATAFAALIKLAPEIQSLGLQFLPVPSGFKGKLQYPDITVSVPPDLVVHGERNGVPLAGMLRFYTVKGTRYQLGQRGAELVATMQYLCAVQAATGSRTPDTSLCLVIETLQQRITKAPSDFMHNAAVIERGCREMVQLWDSLSHDEAA